MTTIIACHAIKQCIVLGSGKDLPFETDEKSFRVGILIKRSVGAALVLAFLIVSPEWNWLGEISSTDVAKKTISVNAIAHIRSAELLFGLTLCLLPIQATSKPSQEVRPTTVLFSVLVTVLFIMIMSYSCLKTNGILHIASLGIENGQLRPGEMQFGITLPETIDWNNSLIKFNRSTNKDTLLACVVLITLSTLNFAKTRPMRIAMTATWFCSLGGLCIALKNTRDSKIPGLGAGLSDYYLVWPETRVTVLLFIFVFFASFVVAGSKQRSTSRQVDSRQLIGLQYPPWLLTGFVIGLIAESYLIANYSIRILFGSNSWLAPSVFSPVTIAYFLPNGIVVVWTLLLALLATRQIASHNQCDTTVSTFKFTRHNLTAVFLRALAVSMSLPPIAIAFGNFGFSAVLSADSMVANGLLEVEKYRWPVSRMGECAALITVCILSYSLWAKRQTSSPTPRRQMPNN